MTMHSRKTLVTFILALSALLPAAGVLAHSGHGAPEVHAHAGSPSLLAVLAIIALGVGALVALARLAVHRRRRLQQR